MICKPPSCRPPLLLSCEKARLDTQSPTLIDGKQLAAVFASSLCGGCQCFSIAVFYCGGAGASGRGRGADDNQQALRIIFERLAERSRLLQRVCSSDQASLRRPMVEAESPPASLPSEATKCTSPKDRSRRAWILLCLIVRLTGNL